MSGKELKIIRQLIGLTQKELGILIGVNDSTVAKYENGNLDINKETQTKLINVFFTYGIEQSEIEILRYLLSIKGGKDSAGN